MSNEWWVTIRLSAGAARNRSMAEGTILFASSGSKMSVAQDWRRLSIDRR
jgi:hypothetical protein